MPVTLGVRAAQAARALLNKLITFSPTLIHAGVSGWGLLFSTSVCAHWYSDSVWPTLLRTSALCIVYDIWYELC